MKVKSLDFLIIYAACLAYMLVNSWVAVGVARTFYKFPLIMFFNLFEATICFLIFLISIRILKSRFCFFVASWATNLSWLYFGIVSAKNINLTLRSFGYDIYVNGNITSIGITYNLLYQPLGIMAIIATILLIRDLLLKYRHKPNLEKGDNHE